MTRTFITLLVAVPSAQTKLLNVSYDPTRELYQDFNAARKRRWSLRHAGPHDPRPGDRVYVKPRKMKLFAE